MSCLLHTEFVSCIDNRTTRSEAGILGRQPYMTTQVVPIVLPPCLQAVRSLYDITPQGRNITPQGRVQDFSKGGSNLLSGFVFILSPIFSHEYEIIWSQRVFEGGSSEPL